jgi:hypothetical protein
VTLQQLGANEVVGYYDKQEDVSVAAFWYEPIPSDPLPSLPDHAARLAPGRLGGEAADMSR